MANEVFNMDPERSRYVKANVPVVLFEEDVEVLIDNTSCLPELALKIDHIDVSVRDLEVDPIFIHEKPCKEDLDYMEHHHCHMEHHPSHMEHHPSHMEHDSSHMEHHIDRDRVAKIHALVIHGTLHKQIYYVNRDETVKHTAEDIPFTKMVHLRKKFLVMDEDMVIVTIKKVSADIRWELVKASRLHQTGMVNLRVKLIEEREMYVQVAGFARK